MRVEFLTPLRGSLFIICYVPMTHIMGYILSPLRGFYLVASLITAGSA